MIEKKLRGYILPNILATTGTSCYVLADTIFISMAEGANGITGLNLVLPIFAIIMAILYFTDNLQSNIFWFTLVGSIVGYFLYISKVVADYNMTSASVKNRGINQIDFNNNYSEKIEYCKDIDLGTRIIGRSRIESRK